MVVERNKLQQLLRVPFRYGALSELRREKNVFLVGGDLPAHQTLETIFDSCVQQSAELFCVEFGSVDSFHLGEELTRLIKKNFSVHVIGRFDGPVPLHLLERAYAAGVDIIDIPLVVTDAALSRERGTEREARLASLAEALQIFPHWGVASTLIAGDEPPCSTISGIDILAGHGIVPLVTPSQRGAHYGIDELEGIFQHLATVWRKQRMVTKPLLPLLDLTTPLEPARPGGMLKGFIDRLYDRQLLAASDLRRSLRVRQIEESFESSGL